MKKALTILVIIIFGLATLIDKQIDKNTSTAELLAKIEADVYVYKPSREITEIESAIAERDSLVAELNTLLAKKDLSRAEIWALEELRFDIDIVNDTIIYLQRQLLHKWE